MWWFGIYIVVTYLLAGSVAAFISIIQTAIRTSCPRLRRPWFDGGGQIAIALCLFLPLLPYIQVAFLTVVYSHLLLPPVRQAENVVGPVSEIKVLEMSADSALVYVVGPVGCDTSLFGRSQWRAGCTIRLRRVRHTYVFGDWDCVWSDCGSADSCTFPTFPDHW